MKNKILTFSLLSVVLFSCGKKETKVEETTLIEKEVDTVMVMAEIDSVAIHDHYEADHHLDKGEHALAPKTHKNKKVLVDSHPIVDHHDVLTPRPKEPVKQGDMHTEENKTLVIVLHDKEYFYFLPDEKATFPGGEKAFDEFILKNMVYPDAALEGNIQGTTYANVYLDEAGNVFDVIFPAKKLGYGLEEETKNLLMKSPRWNPAKHEGKGVKSKFIIPITYKIN
jgi:hypothetical protein